MSTRATTRSRARAGFTLLEMIIVISIMAIVAGAAVPLASMAINSKARRATVDELEGLQLAVGEYFRDTGQLPSAISDMEQDPGVGGWTGPYLQAFSLDRNSGLSQYSVDAWSQSYTLSASGSVLTITSPGQGGALGDGNDISMTVDVTPIRREQTLAKLKIVNQAIQKYNDTWLDSDPLPATYSTVLTKLVSKGYLPSTTPFDSDGWGDPLVPDPAGLSPVVQVTSSHL